MDSESAPGIVYLTIVPALIRFAVHYYSVITCSLPPVDSLA